MFLLNIVFLFDNEILMFLLVCKSLFKGDILFLNSSFTNNECFNVLIYSVFLRPLQTMFSLLLFHKSSKVILF